MVCLDVGRELPVTNRIGITGSEMEEKPFGGGGGHLFASQFHLRTFSINYETG